MCIRDRTGTHGGIEHVIVWFDRETKELLAPDDKILVKSFGQGLEIEGFEDIRVMNIDPDLFETVSYTHLDVYKRQCADSIVNQLTSKKKQPTA